MRRPGAAKDTVSCVMMLQEWTGGGARVGSEPTHTEKKRVIGATSSASPASTAAPRQVAGLRGAVGTHTQGVTTPGDPSHLETLMPMDS